MARGDVAGSNLWPSSGGCDGVASSPELTEEAQRLSLQLLQVGAAEVRWGTLVEMPTRPQEDERTRDLVTRLGAIPRARAQSTCQKETFFLTEWNE